MQNDQIYSELISLIVTKDDFNLINSELDLLEDSLYESKNNTFESVLKNAVEESHAKLISKLIINEEKLKAINKIKEYLRKMTFVELTLSKDPTEEVMEKIITWLKTWVRQNIAIDIKVDQKIIGGALIIYNGKYFDGSVKSKLDEILKSYV